MTNDPQYNRLRELSWRRKLTQEEQEALHGWLAAHPQAQAEWEAETALNQTLERMADAPVPGNFTARVLQAVEREEAAGARRDRRPSFWGQLRWLPRIAVAAIVLCAGLISYQQLQLRQNRERALAVATVAEVSSLPGPDVLEDFDAIQAASRTGADEELLAALK